MKEKPKASKRASALVSFGQKRSAAHAALRKKMHPQAKRMHDNAKEY